jgi:superfamily II DNA/RNA helicase
MMGANLIKLHTLFQNPAISGSFESSISFSDTGINSDIIDVLKEQEITEPTVIQVCLPEFTSVYTN